jgi:CDP-glucose 4,6-dehydratase
VTTKDIILSKRILVTGCRGFIGRHLCLALANAGATVTGTSRKPPHPESDEPRQAAGPITFFQADLCDFDNIAKVLDEAQPDYLVHLGAASIAQPGEALARTNEQGTLNVLNGLSRYVPQCRLLFASTAAVYGGNRGVVDEDTAPIPLSQYASSKYNAERMVRAAVDGGTSKSLIMRLSNIYGGGDTNWSRLVPDLARAAARGEPMVLRSDGKGRADFLYIDDLVSAFFAAITSASETLFNGETLNICSGNSVSSASIAQNIADLAGRDRSEIQYGSTAMAGVGPEQISAHRARQQLGWYASTSLLEGLQNSYAEYQVLNGTKRN